MSDDPRPLSERSPQLVRFDVTQRLTHWVIATLFLSLMSTALSLHFGSLFGVVWPRHVVSQIHVWSGLALPVPVVLSLVGPWGRATRRDLRAVGQWRREELSWLRSAGQVRIAMGKFNPGQKLNTIFIGASIVVTLITGVILRWFRYFPVAERTNATFVHDVFAVALFVVITGHVIMGVTHRAALRSMIRGGVSRSWAEAHAPLWVAEKSNDGEAPREDHVALS